MWERFDTLSRASVLALAACGGVGEDSAWTQSTESLWCQTDTDCHEGYTCTHFSARSYCEAKGRTQVVASFAPTSAPSEESDRSLAGLCRGGECQDSVSEGPSSAPAPGLDDTPVQPADAGVDSAPGASSAPGAENCLYGSEGCERDACSDAGEDGDCRESARDADSDRDSEERSRPNRGRH
ncbi:MAG TPA: hypothetical protein VJU61_23495 [Polyangiaceae bacterium]|nr:hypothetical protein [Polyangiaceae bacterium]